MTLDTLFEDQSIKAKGKAKEVAKWLESGELAMEELLLFAEGRSPVDKATCMEGIEGATRKSAGLADQHLWEYASAALSDKEPRVKWESARVIGNIAQRFEPSLELAIPALLQNAREDGTVVRWAAAYALGEILKLKTEHNRELLPAITALCEKEADNGVRNKYLDALKRVKP